MSQKLSHLIKTRKARKGSRCQGALDRQFQRVGSQEEESAVSPSNEGERSQSSSIEASPETLHVDQEPKTKNSPTTLLLLPTELILAVAHYLSPCGYMSLSYSCRTIRNKMGASIAHVLGDKVPIGQPSGSTLSIESRNIRFLERLDLGCMLDYDRKYSSSKASSARFKDTLYHSSFSLLSPRPLREYWRCSGNAGLLWICPNQTYDYNEATRSREISKYYECECSPLFRHGRVEDVFFVSFRIMRVSRDLEPSYEEVKEALRPLDAPVCPHLRLNDACVASAYHRDCRKTRRNPDAIGRAPDCGGGLCPSERLRRTEICNFCDTILSFDIITERDGAKTLIVAIIRFIRRKLDCTDREWIAQLAQPADFEEYERAWQATHAECLRKVGTLSLI